MNKGIILAGGSSSRLWPVCTHITKQLLPIYDKPMIYYPLSVLMLAGIKDILMITTPDEQVLFKKLLGNGSDFGINLTYAIQGKPNGIAEAFIIGKDFIGKDNVMLILGDNIFFGQHFNWDIDQLITDKDKATVFAYHVSDPERYGVVEFDDNGKAISIEEKPKLPKSNYAVTGLYYYPNSIIEVATNLKPSARGELEITDCNKHYLKNNELNVVTLGRGFAWLDTGEMDALLECSNFVKIMQDRTGLQIANLEEIAYKNSWISSEQLQSRAILYQKNAYGKYLKGLLND